MMAPRWANKWDDSGWRLAMPERQTMWWEDWCFELTWYQPDFWEGNEGWRLSHFVQWLTQAAYIMKPKNRNKNKNSDTEAQETPSLVGNIPLNIETQKLHICNPPRPHRWCLSPFDWLFYILCENKTKYNIALSWVLGVILVNYHT